MRYFCKHCKKKKFADEMDKRREGRPLASTCRKCRSKRQAAWKRNHPSVHLTDWARRRAKVSSLPFNITKEDVIVPEFCPVLGIKLEKGPKRIHDASPSLDRLVPEKGYTKGNVVVISYKANRMRNNASLDELKQLVAWLKKQTSNLAVSASQF